MNKHFGVAFGLLLITLAAFSVVSPVDSQKVDSWFHFAVGRHLAENQDWFHINSNRQFHLLPNLVLQWLVPNWIQGFFVVYLSFLWGTSLGLYTLFRRFFPGYAWFGFLFAAIYLVYIPFNYDRVVALFLLSYAWILCVFITGIALYVEHLYHEGRNSYFLLGLGVLLGYIGVRGYEGMIPIAPFVPLLLFYLKRGFPRHVIASAVVWWLVVGIGSLQFLIPYVREDEETTFYQQMYQEPSLAPVDLFNNTLEFLKRGFPIQEKFIEIDHTFILPGLALSLILGMVTLLLYRQFPSEVRWPEIRSLVVMFVAGLILTGLGGGAFIYAGAVDLQRSQTFAIPGEALMVASVLGLIAVGLSKIRIPQTISSTILLTLFFTTSAQWYQEAHFQEDRANLNFTTSLRLVEGLVRLAANVEQGTVFVNTNCAIKLDTFYAVTYVYNFAGGSGVELTALDWATYDADGLKYQKFPLNARETFAWSSYEEAVIFGCRGDVMYIVDKFPEGYAPSEANVHQKYNPYARIQGGFISDEKASAVSY